MPCQLPQVVQDDLLDQATVRVTDLEELQDRELLLVLLAHQLVQQ